MKNPTIALLGSPNVGKTSLFNRLTKLNQKVGNYPGITVEKREGTLKARSKNYNIVDLPGTYSLYPSSLDEQVVFDVLTNKADPVHPDLVIVVGEPSSVKRAVTLYLQVRELDIPALFVINMADEMEDKGILIDPDSLEDFLKTTVFLTNARQGKGISQLVDAMETHGNFSPGTFDIPQKYHPAMQDARKLFPLKREYLTWVYLAQENIPYLDAQKHRELRAIREKHHISTSELQLAEAEQRKKYIEQHTASSIHRTHNKAFDRTYRIDNVLLHPVVGYIVFLSLLLLIFQAIFTWSAPFMDFIDESFAKLSVATRDGLPDTPLSSLLTDGIIPGIGGIVIFVPQIVILFFFLGILEETGYMSRVVFLMDRWLRPFGLNGKSVVPLMSGAACAIPAVMSARTIEHPKERLLTMLVTPFMTCSARLPIYIVIIGLVIPDTTVAGFHLQGLVLMLMYVLGIIAALGSSLLLNIFIKSVPKSYFIFEIPTYKAPHWRNVLFNVWEKASSFVFGAGKIILSIAIVLWVLGNFGPNDRYSDAEHYVSTANPELEGDAFAQEVASYQLEHSYLGYIGMVIEPVVRPLGYDWKMGIGILSSFAAREVFVGTMAVVYSLGDTVDIEDDGERGSLLARMRNEVNRNTGQPAYNFASGISLLLFYAFAMQCMATIAVVRRETGSWKWTLFQLIFMTGLAYAVALIAYQTLK